MPTEDDRVWMTGDDVHVATIDARILRAQMRGDFDAVAALLRERMEAAREAVACHG